MTAISAVFHHNCIAVSTDSLLTTYNKKEKKNIVIETKYPKIIILEKLDAIISYWGFAGLLNSKWSTFNWLLDKAKNSYKFNSLESFSKNLRNELKREFENLNIPRKNLGIGIHITGFEKIIHEKTPELFLISNYTDPSYKNIGNLNLSRHLYQTLPDRYKEKNIDLKREREIINNFLKLGKLFIFNNGDPKMYNPISNAN